ncbi:MAG: prepilin-type N-terminal cleavage/methylation domain-containing protein [Synergistaceae bacterium]|nr:prepilin-type N-terminal cleavage/methylation domain-containing protein [Candidatus Equadaptatus faecalis]
MADGKSHGFSLIEVMLAVAVLSLTATASLKLVVMAQNGLRAAKEQEDFLLAAEKLRAKVMTGEVSENGSEDNLSWKTEQKTKEFFTEDFGKLDFNRKTTELKPDANFSWRELELENKITNKKIKIVLPSNGG